MLLLLDVVFSDSIVDITCSVLKFSHWVSVDSSPYFIFRFFFSVFFVSFIVFNKLLFVFPLYRYVRFAVCFATLFVVFVVRISLRVE